MRILSSSCFKVKYEADSGELAQESLLTAESPPAARRSARAGWIWPRLSCLGGGLFPRPGFCPTLILAPFCAQRETVQRAQHLYWLRFLRATRSV